jgi:hypothetical protein
MIIPLALGSLAALILVALMGSRNMLVYILIEIFVSGALALAGVAASTYALFTGPIHSGNGPMDIDPRRGKDS